jgi:sulfur relay (sulfurtransferase) complex TusBCD TusD component (DsrE family)
MNVLLVVSAPPYGSEGPYNALRLAEALALRGEHVELFLMGDAVHAARAGQEPREAHASLEQMLHGALERGVAVTCCGTCCRSRGVQQADLIEGVHVHTIHDLAASLAACDRSLSL